MPPVNAIASLFPNTWKLPYDKRVLSDGAKLSGAYFGAKTTLLEIAMTFTPGCRRASGVIVPAAENLPLHGKSVVSVVELLQNGRSLSPTDRGVIWVTFFPRRLHAVRLAP